MNRDEFMTEAVLQLMANPRVEPSLRIREAEEQWDRLQHSGYNRTKSPGLCECSSCVYYREQKRRQT